MKFDHSSRRMVAFALYIAFTFGAVAPAFAQSGGARPTRPQRGATGSAAPVSLQSGQPRGLAPTRRASLVGEGGRFLPADVPVRTTYGVDGFQTKKPGGGRVQIGGPFGANVPEKVVDITQTQTQEERTPFWSSDEQSLYFSSNREGRYSLYRLAPSPGSDALLSLPATRMTVLGGFDYLFPAVDAGNTRIAFLRSADTAGIDDPNKRFDLYVATLPTGTQTIDEAPGGPSVLIPITRQLNGNPRTFPTTGGQEIVNVRRASWVGPDELAFTARLANKDNYDLFIVNVSSRQITQMTDSPADEQNAAVSPDGRTIAFDSDAVFVTDTTNEPYTAGTPRTDINPGAIPATAPRNGNGQRQIYTMDISGQQSPRQFTGRFTNPNFAADITNVEPAWSYEHRNGLNFSATNPAKVQHSLAWSSNRKVVFDPADATRTVVTGFTSSTTFDVYYALQNNNYTAPGNTVFEDSLNDAKRLDTADDEFVFDDRYPTWSPLLTVLRIGFQSNRIGSYNKDSFGQGFGNPIAARDLFVASIIDITAPTLIRFDTNSVTGEIVHINPGSTYNANQRVRTRDDGVLPNSSLFFTVRVEDREAGMRQPTTTGATPKAVFLQFKNPNSKYQSQAQGGAGVERKEFFFNPSPFFIPGTPVQAGFTFSENNNGNPAPVYIQGGGRQHGTEFECEAISASDRTTYFRHRGNTLTPNGPLYFAGWDDLAAFSGTARPPLDGNGGRPNVWLELVPLTDGNGNPIRPADGRGGVLYGASWQIPGEASDWIIDVICYDNAVNPYNAAQQSNFIIYDNVWGFSSALPIAGQPTDLLVISDYSLGQKFFASRFGVIPDPTTVGNLLPIYWGAEAAMTDIDVTRYPAGGSQAPFAPNSTTARFWDPNGPFGVTTSFPNATGHRGGAPTTGAFLNTLGVNSYIDEDLVSGTLTVDGRPLAPTSRYNIWRTLCRGPIPTSVLQSYLPQSGVAPPDPKADPAETQPRTIQIHNRAVLWLAPFSGNQFVGPGTITDVTVQNQLSDFVNQGGRLFISGQDIGFALAGNGQNNSFFTNTLGAQYQGDDSGAINLSANTAAPPIYRQDSWAPSAQQAMGRTGNGITYSYDTPSSGDLFIVNEIPTIADQRGDGAYTARARAGRNDIVAAAADATAEFNYSGGGVAMVSKTFPSGGRTFYSAVGFESISNDWYTYSNPAGVGFIATLGRRVELLHNVTDGFRTGTILGRVLDDNGSPVSDALVRAVSPSATTAAAAGTASTDAAGNFVIQGLPSGFYQLEAYKAGYYTQKTLGNTVHGGWRSQANINVKRANPGSLTGIRQSASNQGGIFRADGVTPIENVEVRAELFAASGSALSTVALRTISSDGDDSNNAAQAADPRYAGATISSGPRGAYQFPSLQVVDPAFGYHIIVNPSASPAVRDELTKDVALTAAANPARFRLGPNTTVVDANPDPNIDRGHVVIQENVTSQIDFFLSSGPQQVVGAVFEQTTDASGNIVAGAPIVGATVQAVAVVNGAPTTTVVASATTVQDGTYRLVVTGGDPNNPNDILIPEGIYDITATAPGYSSTKPPSERPVVQVTVGGVSSVAVMAAPHLLFKLPPGSASGNVTRQPGNQPAANATIRLYPVINGVRQPNPIATVATSFTPQQNNGGYLFNWKLDSVPAGDYQATASLPGFVSDPAFSGVFTVTSGQETRNINFSMRAPKDYGAGLQLISVPFDYSNVPARSVFGLNSDDGFNLATWITQQSTYQTGPNLPLELKKGYFARFPAQVAISLIGAPNQADSTDITLFPGWNLIGNPFSDKVDPSVPGPNIDLAVDSRIVLPDGTVLTLDQAVAQNLVRGVAFGYTGSNANSQYFQSAVIQTWLGYWFRNTDPQQRTLTLRFVRPTSRAVKLTSTRAVSRAETEAVRFRSITTTAPNNWRLQIAAKQGDLLDTDNSIGVAPGAKDGFDNKFDTEKPPMMTEAAQVYVALDAKNEAGRAAPFSDDIRAADSESFKTWEFTVQATGQGEVSVYWPNINRLPRNVEPILVDLANNRRVAMRGTSTYRFAPEGSGTTRRFRVEVAKPLSLPLTLTNVKQTRVIGRGPGGGGFRFSFTVSRSADVVAEIQTLTGRTVQRMSSRAAASTESTIVWNGRNQEGAVLPAGPYVLSLTARDTNGNTAQVRLPIMQLR